jgi:hypothetical protein
VAEIPTGGKLSLIVETGDKAGKVPNSQTIELESGKHVYSLKSAKTSDQIRFRTQLSASTDGQSPVLRAVSLIGANRTERWSTPSEWDGGTAEKSVAVNDSTPQGVD